MAEMELAAAPFEHSEAERLAAVRSYGILDSPPEQEYDDLVLLARTICDAPIAVLTLADGDRQWFKAVVGMDAKEVPSDVSFCSHAILGVEVMQVPDATIDERFAGSPWVIGDPCIRFYAGAPLINAEGMAIGILCVLDRSPRQLRPEQVAALQALSRQAMSLLELRRATDELNTRAAGTRAIIDSASDAFVGTDASGTIIDWNPRAEVLFGWSREEAIGRSMAQLIVPPRFHRTIQAEMEALLTDRPTHIFRHRLELDALHRDGRQFPIDVTVWTMRSGTEVCFYGLVRDRTDALVDLDEIREVREAHDLFAAVLGATTEYAIIGTDVVGKITFFNVGAEKMLGYRSAELVGRHTPLVLHEAEEIYAWASELGAAPGFGVLAASALGGRNKIREWTYVRKDGVRLVVSVSITPMKGIDGRLVGFIATAFDITERHQADEARSRLAAMVESAYDAMISSDPDGIIRSWNSAAERLFGYTAEEAVGQPVAIIKREDQQGEVTGIMESLRRHESVVLHDAVRFSKDGNEIPVTMALSPLWDAQGRFAGASAVIRDITERKRNEAAVSDALARQSEMVERLQELDRAKTAFVSSVSHELRTPLAGMLGYVEILAGGDAGELEADQLRILEIVDACTKRLSLLIEDLLTVSQIESGGFRLDPGPVAVGPLLEAARQAVVATLVNRQLTISVEHPHEAVTIWADGSQLERMLTNLMTNAVKFTPDGGRVQLAWRPVVDGVVLTVSDTGMGIPIEDQPMLFDRFFRSTSARQLAIPGTGLGLGIVKSIVDEHGGSIEIISAVGEGTEVAVTLPAALDRPSQEPGNNTNRSLSAAVLERS